MKPWLLVSFYTPEPLYVQHAEGLAESCRRFKVPCEIDRVAPAGSWPKNVKMKGAFILQKLAEHPGTNIVWVDADARVRQYPALFDTLDADVAAHWKDGRQLLAGTMYFKNSGDVGRKLLVEWIEEMKKPRYVLFGEQRSLDAILDRHLGRWRVVDLPAPYTLIFDSMRHLGPPVIEHLQASRKAFWNKPRRSAASLFREQNPAPHLSEAKEALMTPVPPSRIGVGDPSFEKAYPNAKPASLLKDTLKGKPCIIYGNSSSLNRLPLEKLLEFPAITCNRGLRLFQPDYYIVVDRDPYCQDLDLIEKFKGVRVLSSTIYNERTTCHRVPVQPIPDFEFYYFRAASSGLPVGGHAGVSRVPVIQTDWSQQVLAAANIAFPMFQLAVMLGANPIGIAGIDLTWGSKSSHFFGDGRQAGCFMFGHNNKAEKPLAFFKQAARWTEDHGIACFNLSPEGILDCWPRLDAMAFYRRFGGNPDGKMLCDRQLVELERRGSLGGRRCRTFDRDKPVAPPRPRPVALGERHRRPQIRSGTAHAVMREQIAAVRAARLRRPKVGPVALG